MESVPTKAFAARPLPPAVSEQYSNSHWPRSSVGGVRDVNSSGIVGNRGVASASCGVCTVAGCRDAVGRHVTAGDYARPLNG